MNSRQGISFADVLILLAIVLLLAALAIPKFVKATDYGNEEDDVSAESAARDTDAGSTNKPAPAVTNVENQSRDSR